MRAVLAVASGDRSERMAIGLFEALPQEFWDGAIFLTDSWPAYRAALPDGRHGECAERVGLMNHVERFWCTLAAALRPPRAQDAVVLDVPFEHVGALWFFVRLDNQSLE